MREAVAALCSMAVALALPRAFATTPLLQVSVAIAAPNDMAVEIPRVFPPSSARSPLPPPARDVARLDRRPPCLHVLHFVNVILVLLLALAVVVQRQEHVERLHVAVLVHKQPRSVPPLHREHAVELVRNGAVDMLHS